jgi:hypothetical protein
MARTAVGHSLTQTPIAIESGAQDPRASARQPLVVPCGRAPDGVRKALACRRQSLVSRRLKTGFAIARFLT